MIVKKDVIKLVKEIGSFDKLGCCFEVLDISEDGMVEFKNHFMGKGVMDVDAMNKCFEKATDEEKESYLSELEHNDNDDYYDFDEDDDENE